MTEREKIIKIIESTDLELTLEGLIKIYIGENFDEFSISRISRIIDMLNDISIMKAESIEANLSNIVDYASYLKMYLEGKLYTSKEMAEAHVNIQIGHVDKILKMVKSSK